MDKKIYILMATYNGEKYLKEQIDSLLSQTYQDWVLWIHDDNSKDNTAAIIQEYKIKYPQKIVYLDDNIGTGGAKENFVYLLEKIDDNFDYVMFCDQDDVWLDDKIEITLSKMIEVENIYRDKPILIHTDLKVVDEKLNIISESMFQYQRLDPSINSKVGLLLVQNVISGCTMMINRRSKKIVLPVSMNAIMHDWWIGLKVLLNNGIISHIDTSTILYRQHTSNDVGAKIFSLNTLIKKVNSFYKYKIMADSLKMKITFLRILLNKLYITAKRL